MIQGSELTSKGDFPSREVMDDSLGMARNPKIPVSDEQVVYISSSESLRFHRLEKMSIFILLHTNI